MYRGQFLDNNPDLLAQTLVMILLSRGGLLKIWATVNPLVILRCEDSDCANWAQGRS